MCSPYVNWVGSPARKPRAASWGRIPIGLPGVLAAGKTTLPPLARPPELSSLTRVRVGSVAKCGRLPRHSQRGCFELLSGLETEQGRCQLREGPFACRFSIQRTRSPRGITLYKKEIFKVRCDLAFLAPQWRRLRLQAAPFSWSSSYLETMATRNC